jgi:peroxiredoxin
MLKFSSALVCAVTLIAQPLANQGLSGRRAPSFSLPDVRLQQHDILDYRGKWLRLDFMYTSCPHCKELSKKLEGVMARYGGKVAVLSIVVPPDNQTTVAKYILETKITSPIVFDSTQVAVAYFKATPATQGFDTPHLFAIDPNGMIVKDWGQAAVETPGFLGELDQLFNKK